MLSDRGEVVALRGPVHAVTRRVERLHGAGQPELVVEQDVDERTRSAPRCSPSRCIRSMSSAKLVHPLGVALGVEPGREPPQCGDVALLGDPVGDPRVQRT